MSWFKRENAKLNVEYKGNGVFMVPLDETKEFVKLHSLVLQAEKDMKGRFQSGGIVPSPTEPDQVKIKIPERPFIWDASAIQAAKTHIDRHCAPPLQRSFRCVTIPITKEKEMSISKKVEENIEKIGELLAEIKEINDAGKEPQDKKVTRIKLKTITQLIDMGAVFGDEDNLQGDEDIMVAQRNLPYLGSIVNILQQSGGDLFKQDDGIYWHNSEIKEFYYD